MRSSRAVRSTLGALALVLGIGVGGYVAQAKFRSDDTPSGSRATRAEPPAPGIAYVEAPESQPPVASDPAQVPATGPGRFVTASGGSAAVGRGRINRYVVVVEENAGVAPAEFAGAVERTLAESRGWTASGRWGFQRVSGGASDFTIHLATPGTTDRLCDRVGVETRGEVSCRGGRTLVINLKRWQLAVPWYADAVDDYRTMVVNHEVGHFLGHGHVTCRSAGGLAPVMQKQTLGLNGCQRNPWPYPDGSTFLTGPSTS